MLFLTVHVRNGFKSGNLDLEDEEHPGQSKKFKNEALEKLLEENPCRTQSELADALGVTQAISKRFFINIKIL